MQYFPFLIVLSSPSGAGKSTLCRALLQEDPSLVLSLSMTTRPPRPQEKNGEHYLFVSHEEFQHHIGEENFLEYTEVFGNLYGTPLSSLQENLRQGLSVVLDIDRKGAQRIRSLFPSSVISIFVLPPSLEALRHRLTTRKHDDPEAIECRLSSAVEEISHCGEYDYLIVNDHLETAMSDLRHIIGAERLRTQRRTPEHLSHHFQKI